MDLPDYVTTQRHSFCKKIKTIRKDKRLTHEDMAELTGMNVNYYARIERNEINFTFDKLIRISIALDIPVSDLFFFP